MANISFAKTSLLKELFLFSLKWHFGATIIKVQENKKEINEICCCGLFSNFIVLKAGNVYYVVLPFNDPVIVSLKNTQRISISKTGTKLVFKEKTLSLELHLVLFHQKSF